MDKSFLNIMLVLANNSFILLALVFFYIASNYDLSKKNRLKQLIPGFLIGISSLIMMNQPFMVSEGVLIDSRSILFTIAGNFFGFIPTLIGVVIGVGYRLIIGGPGVLVGVMIIIMNAMFGIFWSVFISKIKIKNDFLKSYLFGLVTQLLTAILIITLPQALIYTAPVLVIYLGFYPVAIALLSLVIIYQKNRMNVLNLLNLQNSLLKQSVDSIDTSEIFTIDSNYKYLSFNKHHKFMMKRYNFVSIDQNTNFLESIKNHSLKETLKDNINKSFKGENFKETKNLGDHYYEYQFNTLLNEEDAVIGVTIFAKDVTSEVNHEQDLINNSYIDTLTNLYNRRYFNVVFNDIEFYNIVSVIFCDVNGLKIINDSFGHHVGDQYLFNFAKILKEKFEHSGYVFRMGGDEFCIILPNVDKEDATYMMDEVSKEVEQTSDSILKISFSYGVETKKMGGSLAKVIKESEEQMYKQKLFESTSHRSKFIETILTSLYEKNPLVEKHSARVSLICNEIGKKLNMTKYELSLLEVIAKLHDIGKIAIDESILNKNYKLTDAEWQMVKRHPEIGYRLISTSPEYKEIAYDILSHHERYDGKGYPQGLKGEAIPLRARIVTIADSFDAMISERSYKEKMTIHEALEEIKSCSGTQFDPELVKVFIKIATPEFFEIIGVQ